MNTCPVTGKQQYTLHGAVRACRGIRRRTGIAMSHYSCPFCHQRHVTRAVPQYYRMLKIIEAVTV